MNNKLGAAGNLPPCVVLAGGDAASEPRRSSKRAPPWSAEDIATIRTMSDAGRSQTQIAHALGMSATGFKLRATRLGVPFVLDVKGKAEARGAAVLHEHYENNPDITDVLALFGAAVGRRVSRKIMGECAYRLGLKRGEAGRQRSIDEATAARLVIRTRKRQERAVEFQALLNVGHSAASAARALGCCDKTVAIMRRDGLIVVPPQVAPVKRAPLGNRTMTNAEKQARYRAKVAAARAIKPPKAPVPVVHVAPTPSPPVPLPPPAENGKIYAGFTAIQQWAENVGIEYDGSNMDRVNKRRTSANLPQLVQEG